jgi:processive 1,2-diacylglycerol beta-glucosyltransferase
MIVSQRLPTFWKLLFHSTKDNRVQKGVEKMNRFFAAQFLRYLRRVKPTIIVTTHFFPLYFIAAAKMEMPIKVITIVTDLLAHPLWMHPCVDLYFVATEETKGSLVRCGVESEKVISGYVPLREGFLRDLSEVELRKKFSLDEKPCLLFMSSTRGKFPILKGVLPALKNDFNIFVIYGKNKKLKRYLSRLHYPRLRFFSYYEPIWELFQLSSVIITKPGGLTIFEGLYKRKPFIFTSFIPGHEKENMDLLARHGIGRFVQRRKDFLSAVHYFESKKTTLKHHYPIRVKDIRPVLKELIEHLNQDSGAKASFGVRRKMHHSG